MFKPCHHIELNTKNPNPILKITIHFTKTPKMPKYFRNVVIFWKVFEKNENVQKIVFILYDVQAP